MSALVFFDIDGTLLLSGGAGMRAMTRAFERTFGVADAFEGIPVAGFTDSFLLSKALDRAGREDSKEAHARFRDAYLRLLADEIAKPGTGRRGLMPGVEQLLQHLAKDGRAHSALLTGNYERAAHIKLAQFGVARFFSWGAFGDDSPDRAELARLALMRAQERAIPRAARDNVIVVGDTPHDVSCAHAIGARAVAVATGSYTRDDLRRCGADVVLDDLSDTAEVAAVLRYS